MLSKLKKDLADKKNEKKQEQKKQQILKIMKEGLEDNRR